LGREGLALDSLADLYRDVSLGYGPTGIGVLSDWLLGGNQGQVVTAAALLEEVPNRFVFDHLELVGQTLDRAEGFGDECLGAVARGFSKIAPSGMRSGTPGQPYPQDIALRDRCLEVLPRLPEGGTANRLFRDVLRRAERDIEAAAREDDDE